MEMLEKRACERYELHLPVNITWKEPSGGIMENSSICKDISSGGAYITLNKPLEKGCEVSLRFDLVMGESGTNRVFTVGEIVRRIKENGTGFGHGIKFRSYKTSRLTG